MALLPTESSLTSASTTSAQQKLNFSALRNFLADLLGTDSADKQAARVAMGLGAYSLMSGRNRIINGGFSINQRGYVSAAATTAGQYTLDRWKVTGTGGITFSTTNNKTTVTIPAGQTLQQVIEGLNLEGGAYVLSWQGTAQGRVGSGSYGASGSVTAAVVGGTNTTVEFNAGTVTDVQFELGTVVTPFERVEYGEQLRRCQRYYYRQINYMGQTAPYNSESTGARGTAAATAIVYRMMRPHPVEMRATPTVSFANLDTWDGVVQRAVTSISNNNSSKYVRSLDYNTSAAMSGAGLTAAEFVQPSGFIDCSAEL